MKRLGIFFLVFLLFVSFASCGKPDSAPPDDAAVVDTMGDASDTLPIDGDASEISDSQPPSAEVSPSAGERTSDKKPADAPAKPSADKPEVTSPAEPAETSEPKPTPELAAPEVPATTAPAAVVSISIRGFEGSFSYSGTVVFVDGDTVAKVLTRYCDEKGIAYKLRGSGKNAYIVSIGGQKEFDHGPLSGWQYSVNGVRASKGAGNYTLQAGDSVLWEYLTEL